MEIRVDDLREPATIALVGEHLRVLSSVSPPESFHALAVEQLRRPEVTFWSVWEGEKLAGFGALKELDAERGEIKSMRTADGFKRRGVASMLLTHIESVARGRGYRRLLLETGAGPYFEPARQLYVKVGFVECGPFGEYKLDPNSVFYEREL